MTRILAIILLAVGSLVPTGCAHREKSQWRIIDEGDRNPMINYAPAHAGERIRKEGAPRQ